MFSKSGSSHKAIKERIEAYGKGFFIAEISNKINGGATDDPEIKDEYFESMDLYHDDGKIWLSSDEMSIRIIKVMVIQDYL